MVHEKVAKDFSALCQVDVGKKLEPIGSAVDDMLARLEEFQTILTFAKHDRTQSTNVLNLVANDLKGDLDELCNRIDGIENLITHITCNLDMLEANVSKHEAASNQTEGAMKVSNIFTPLFKKSPEKKSPVPSYELFKTEDYFK